jgi:hypothetical protein
MVNIKPKVLRTEYSKLTQDNLAIFAENVTTQCTAKAYDSVRAFVTAVAEKTTTYRLALVDATNRGKIQVLKKDLAMKDLYAALGALATNLDAKAGVDELYIVNAGFTIQGTTSTLRNTELQPPAIQAVDVNGIKGEAKVMIKKGKQRGYLTTGVEQSYDEGVTWQNGTYSSTDRFTMSGLQSGKVMLRCRNIGTNNRTSNWSPVFVADVY